MKSVDHELPFQLYLKGVYQQFRKTKEGNVADYIPELSKVDADAFGISLVTTDGTIQQIGQSQCEFTIQSISKPFVYGLVLEDLGVETVRSVVSTEPSGDAFNSISLEPGTGRPLNPMINAGAIAVTSCVKGTTSDKRFLRILDTLSQYAGRNLSIDTDVYQSEKITGHRNRAIMHMLRNFNVVKDHPEVNLDLYFKQCSILANCNDLATMACTLANDGINPITGKRVINSELVPLVLSVMSLCGMYDYSGQWIYEIGLPAKSGVGGGIIVVLPGQFGLAVYSPRLDIRGNSVRGTLVCKQLAQDFGLHLLKIPKIAHTVIRSAYTLKHIRSKRVRSAQGKLILEKTGDKAQVFILQGELRFVTAEAAVRAIYKAARIKKFIIVNFRRVSNIDAGACKLLDGMISQIKQCTDCVLIFAEQSASLFNSSIDLRQQNQDVHFFDNMDYAIEWCENQIIARLVGYYDIPKIALDHNELCHGMSPSQIKIIGRNTRQVMYNPGDYSIHTGQKSENIFS